MGTDRVLHDQQNRQYDQQPSTRRGQKMEYAGMLDRRTEAALFDSFVVHIGMFILGYLFGMVAGGQLPEIGFAIFAGIYLAPIALLLYHIVLEGVYGHTLGKYVRDIAVRTEAGDEIGLVQSTIRNLMRVIDALPAIYLIGLISGYASDRNQRLGDRAANTVVIRTN